VKFCAFISQFFILNSQFPLCSILPLVSFIHCENLVKIYKVADIEVFALQGLDLTIEHGECTAIIGASGSGKSTLMNVLGGLDRPSAGTALVDGQDLLKLNDGQLDKYRRDKVGFVWQQVSRNLLPYMTAEENVEAPMLLSGRRGRGKFARELLARVGLDNRRSHKLGQLSGGEQQRVAIAVALSNSPKLLLADEPTGELDTQTSRRIFALFRELAEKDGITVLIVSHDAKIAEEVGRVVAIRDGKTSSEIVRQSNASGIVGNIESALVSMAGKEEANFDEFVEVAVLDSAGRVQLPREMREKLGIGKRAIIEQTADGIMIRATDK
jgi:putative ABC transport system ATP-binding protein